MHDPARAGCRRSARTGKPAAEKRLVTLPAGSTRRKKNGTPRAPGRCRLESRWQACSKLTRRSGRRGRPRRGAARAPRLEERLVGHQQRAGDVVEQADADQHRRLPARRARLRSRIGSTALARFQQRQLEGHAGSRGSRAATSRTGSSRRASGRSGASAPSSGCTLTARPWRAAQALGQGVVHLGRAAPQFGADAPRRRFPAAGKWLAWSWKKSRASSFGSRMRRPEGKAMPLESSRAHAPGAVEREDGARGVRAAAGQRSASGFRHRLGRPAAGRRTPRAAPTSSWRSCAPESAARSTRSISASLISSEAVTLRWSCSIRFR